VPERARTSSIGDGGVQNRGKNQQPFGIGDGDAGKDLAAAGVRWAYILATIYRDGQVMWPATVNGPFTVTGGSCGPQRLMFYIFSKFKMKGFTMF
jgi:hypothetical protein